MIVCLGWGSLIWSLRGLPVNSSGCLDHRHDNPENCSTSNGPWLLNGPCLPVEFARESSDGRITLVITPNRRPVQVFSAVMDVPSVEDSGVEHARSALALREGIQSKYISQSVGHWSANSDSGHDEVAVIGNWAEQLGYKGVVWTALKPKFRGKYETPTSDEVLEYLCRDLTGNKLEKAKEYVRRTPAPIRTAYRDEIERVLGWTPIGAY